jgi:hypothetical protein
VGQGWRLTPGPREGISPFIFYHFKTPVSQWQQNPEIYNESFFLLIDRKF